MATYRFPSSGPLFKRAVELLILDDEFSEPALRKALQRLGDDASPEGVKQEKRTELAERLVRALLGREDPGIASAVVDHLEDWDELAAALNAGSVRPDNDAHCLYPILRLALFDLALRLAAQTALAFVRPGSIGTGILQARVDPVWLEPNPVKAIIGRFRSNNFEEFEDLAKVGEDSIHDWKSGARRPRSENLRDFAAALAGRGAEFAPIELALRIAFASLAIQAWIKDAFGADVLEDLRRATQMIADRALQDLLVRTGGASRNSLLEIIRKGGRCDAGGALIDVLVQESRHPVVRDDLRALKGPWSGRVRAWLGEIGTNAEHLDALKREGMGANAEVLLDGFRKLLLRVGDPFRPAIPEVPKELVNDAEFQANQLAAAADAANKRGDVLRAAALAEQAVELSPANAAHRYLFGAILGQIVFTEWHLNEVIGHLELARRARPDWPQPATEIALVLDNAGKWEEAELAFTAAEKVANGWFHFHYARGVNWLRLGKLELAITSLRRALEMNDSLEAARAALLFTLERANRGTSSEARELKRVLEKRCPGKWRDLVPSLERTKLRP